jgi:hypothetical protein
MLRRAMAAPYGHSRAQLIRPPIKAATGYTITMLHLALGSTPVEPYNNLRRMEIQLPRLKEQVMGRV